MNFFQKLQIYNLMEHFTLYPFNFINCGQYLFQLEGILYQRYIVYSVINEAVINNIFSNIPHFRPSASMSDWEPAARNAMKKALPNSELYGCWFHFTQRIWAKTQNVGLAREFRNNQDIECYIKQLMGIPYLPSSLINPTYTCLQMPSSDISDPKC